MMDCSRFRTLVDLHAAGETSPAESEEMLLHARECAACRRMLELAAASAELVRSSLRSIEPGSGFDRAVLKRLEGESSAQAAQAAQTTGARRRTGRIVRYAATVAAVAAAVVVALLVGRANPAPARVLDGELAGGAREIASGRSFTAVRESAIELAGGPRALISAGSRFMVAPGELLLADGACYLVSGPRSSTARGESGGLRQSPVRLAGCRLSAELEHDTHACLIIPDGENGAGTAGSTAAARLLDAIFPPVYAGGPEASSSRELLVVFRGRATVTLGARTWEMAAGEAVFADDGGGSRPFRTADFIERAEAEARRAAERSVEVAGSVALYRGVIASYERDLESKRALRAELVASAAADEAAKAELDELDVRIELVREVRSAHEKRLTEMLSGTAEARAAELAEAARRVEMLRAAEAGYWPAAKRLEEMIPPAR